MSRKPLTFALLLALFVAPAILRAAPPAMKTFYLLTTEQDFRHRWIKGNGTVAYDSNAKIVHIFSAVSMGSKIGGFSYDAPWSEVAFNVAIDQPPGGPLVRLHVLINGEKIDLAPIIKLRATFTLRAAVRPNRNLSLFIDNQSVAEPIRTTDNDLHLIFESESVSGGTLRIANVMIKAAPEPGPAPALPDQKNPGPMKVFSLLQTQADLEKHFRIGQGNVVLNPKTKIITFEKTSDWGIGTLLYHAPWEEVQFDIAIDKQPHLSERKFFLNFGGTGVMDHTGEGFDLSPQITGPGEYRIKAVYIKNKTLAVSVNDKPVTPIATILKDSEVAPLKLAITATYKGTFRLGNFKIKALDEP